MSYFFMFLIVLAVMVVGAVVSLPKSRKRAQAILERQRRLTDNDPDLIKPRWPPQTAPLMAGQTAPGRTVGL